MKTRVAYLLILLYSTIARGSDPLVPAEVEALQKLKSYALECADPVARGLSSLTQNFVDPAQQAAQKIAIYKIISELRNNPAHNPQAILADNNCQANQAAHEQEDREINGLKWQNTLLTSPGTFVGVYKGDFIKCGLLAAEIAADVKLYRELTRRRIEHITTSMITDVDEFLALLKRLEESESRFSSRLLTTVSTAHEFLLRDHLLNPLRRYIQENHNLVTGYVPFNKQTIVPLVGRWVFEKLSSWVESKWIVPSLWASNDMATYGGLSRMASSQRLAENIYSRNVAFQPNQAGYLVPLTIGDSPFTLTTAMKTLLFIINPAKSIQKLTYSDTLNPWMGRMWFVNKASGLGLPAFLFSDSVRLGLEVLGIGYAAKYYDSMNGARWKAFLIENREELHRVLWEYRRALDNASSGEAALAQAKQEVRHFVEKGHEISGWFPGSALSHWWTVRDAGRSNVHTWLGAITCTLVVLKAGHWYFTRTAAIP